MIGSIDPRQLSAPKRAELIYGAARAELSDRLWRAALGDGDDAAETRTGPAADADTMGLDALLALFRPEHRPGDAPPAALPGAGVFGPVPGDAANASPVNAAASLQVDLLGPNARYHTTLSSAAARTGIPAPALAAIVQAEAGKSQDGSWQTYSRNPRSSAAGLGQFLSGTWEDLAKTKGTWLNDLARTRGWLGDKGQIMSEARSALLSLRYDATASINTIADYAQRNLHGLERAGVAIGNGADRIAQSAYLGHHLGLGDAIRFMKGGIDPARARMLLGAQVGAARASQRIAQSGDATAAHRAWFLDYVGRNVRPERFST